MKRIVGVRIVAALLAPFGLALCLSSAAVAGSYYQSGVSQARWITRRVGPMGAGEQQSFVLREVGKHSWARLKLRVDVQSGSCAKVGVENARGALVDEIEFCEGADDWVWSAPLFSFPPRIVVRAEEGGLAGRLTIDAIAVSSEILLPKASVGKNQRENISFQNEVIRKLGRAVAMLHVRPGGAPGHCSGFLIAPRWLLTNWHCVSTPEELRDVVAVFDRDTQDSAGVQVRFEEWLNLGQNLDAVLLRLAEPLNYREHLSLENKRIEASEALAVIQHPEGMLKQVSLIGCCAGDQVNSSLGCVASETSSPSCEVEAEKQANSLFLHRCDTDGGSSGSPIIALNTLRVRGLHRSEVLNGLEARNRGICAAPLIAAIQQHEVARCEILFECE